MKYLWIEKRPTEDRKTIKNVKIVAYRWLEGSKMYGQIRANSSTLQGCRKRLKRIVLG